MKTLLKILTLTIALSSCQLYNAISDEYYKSYLDLPLYMGSELKLGDSVSSDDHRKIARHVKSLISYKKESIENFQSPKESIRRGYGDCEDFSILYLNILYYNFGIKGNLLMLDTTRQVVEGGITNHAIIGLPDGTQIEPQTGEIKNYTIGYKYSFNEVFK